MATAPALPGGFELPLEPRLPRLGSVDAVGLEERAAMLATRSIKKASKVFALDLAIRCIDLTTLEGADTPGKVAALSSKAIRPDPTDDSIPSVAAVCVYPNVVPMGAHEVDMVIDRGAFLSGNYAKVYDEIVRVKELCAGKAHLKVILETGELGSYDNVRRASLRAIAGGADFLKTSTGKVTRNSELPVALCMLEVIRDVHEETGRVVGMKIAGGIRQSKQAVQYLVQVHETLGTAWLTP